MTALNRALETLQAGLGEVRSTLASRAALVEGVAAVAPLIMHILANHAHEKAKFTAALQSRGSALDSFHRGLFVASVSSFEGFVKMFVSALVQMKSADATKFSDLPSNFRQKYVVRASKVLSYVGSGTVNGIPYNFSGLQASIGICFSNSVKPILDGDVFTLLMGNPTWSRIDDTLQALGIDNPFNQSFGSNSHIRGWGKAGWKNNLSAAEKKLDALMDRRNSIVHAAQPLTIVEQDVIDACDFFEAMARGLAAEMSGRLNEDRAS